MHTDFIEKIKANYPFLDDSIYSPLTETKECLDVLFEKLIIKLRQLLKKGSDSDIISTSFEIEKLITLIFLKNPEYQQKYNNFYEYIYSFTDIIKSKDSQNANHYTTALFHHMINVIIIKFIKNDFFDGYLRGSDYFYEDTPYFKIKNHPHAINCIDYISGKHDSNLALKALKDAVIPMIRRDSDYFSVFSCRSLTHVNCYIKVKNDLILKKRFSMQLKITTTIDYPDGTEKKTVVELHDPEAKSVLSGLYKKNIDGYSPTYCIHEAAPKMAAISSVLFLQWEHYYNQEIALNTEPSPSFLGGSPMESSDTNGVKAFKGYVVAKNRGAGAARFAPPQEAIINFERTQSLLSYEFKKSEIVFYSEPSSATILTEDVNDEDEIILVDQKIDIDAFSIKISIPQELIKEHEPIVIETYIFYSNHDFNIQINDILELPHALIETGYLSHDDGDKSYNVFLALDKSEVTDDINDKLLFSKHIAGISFNGPVARIYVLLM